MYEPYTEVQIPAFVWLGLLPLVFALCTAYIKVTIVLSSVRVGMSAESLIPYTAIFALSVVVTMVVMLPIGAEVYSLWQNESMAFGPVPAVSRFAEFYEIFRPLEAFMRAHSNESELLFFENKVDPVFQLGAVIPAFVVSELYEAMNMAVRVLVPFVVVDLLVAKGFLLLNLNGQPLPLLAMLLKISLFLAVGGWDVVIGGLLESYLL